MKRKPKTKITTKRSRRVAHADPALRLKDHRKLKAKGGQVEETTGNERQPGTAGGASTRAPETQSFIREIGSFEAENIARVAHEANRAYCLSLGDSSQPRWEAVTPDLRQSSIHGVEAIAAGRVARPDQSHESWMTERLTQGWTLGPVKDPATKQHPLLVPFEELSQEHQTKDHLFFAVVSTLLSRLPQPVGHDG